MHLPQSKKPLSRYERMPVVCLVFYGIGLLSLGCYIAICQGTAFAEWFNSTVSAAIRGVLSYLTAWIPFSLGEAVIWLLPLALFFVLRHAIRHRCATWRAAVTYVGILLSVVALLFSSFVLTFSAGYRARPLSEKLNLQEEAVSATDLYNTAVILAESINRETEHISFYKNGFSAMGYTFADMNGHLSDAYASFSRSHAFLPHAAARVKPVVLSEVMSHMHITGVYSFFTGEANVNVGFPDYTLPATAAHELAHQRGIAREDEASFLAFLVCTGSDDSYVRYSGYMMAYEYVATALWSADRELYNKATARLCAEVRGELSAYSAFFEKYRDSAAGSVSSAINNSYLQSQGTPGVRSYGMVTDLLVAYYRS